MKSLIATMLVATSTAALGMPYQIGPTDLNVRTGPSTIHPIVGILPFGAIVAVGACMSRDDYVQGPPFCQITWGGMQGWASTSGMYPLPLPSLPLDYYPPPPPPYPIPPTYAPGPAYAPPPPDYAPFPPTAYGRPPRPRSYIER